MVLTPTRRPETMLREQIALVVDFLSDGRSDEDALATCSPGWRPLRWNPEAIGCSAQDCRARHDHSPHPRHVGRWQAEIDGAADRWPRYVMLGVPRAINAMPLLDRLVVRGALVLGIGRTARATRLTNWVKVGEYAGCSDKTAKAHYSAALLEIAEAVWDESGQPRW